MCVRGAAAAGQQRRAPPWVGSACARGGTERSRGGVGEEALTAPQPPTGLPASAPALQEGIRPLLKAATLFLRAEAVLPLAREIRTGAAGSWESLAGQTGRELRHLQGAAPAGQFGRSRGAPDG